MRINYGCSRKDSSEPAWKFSIYLCQETWIRVECQKFMLSSGLLPYENLVKFQT
ncbi:hypothetical protein [Methanosarcina barkeri]|uniref:hypothetical protein n=1 Tax=Methanosarcina barkeri TaxID=2208 RepID=UPI000A4E835A|nr:hypothetical protein [Methanosarcina barkeri]